MTYTVTAGAVFEPVTVADLRQQSALCCDGALDNSQLERYIRSARQYLEAYIGSPLGLQTRQYFFQCWACALELAPNLVSVVSVEYIDADGNTQTIPATDYHVDTVSQPGRVVHTADFTWPALAEHTPNPITVTVTAGYASASAVPDIIKQAILLIAASSVENRENETFGKELKPIPLSAERLVNSLKVVT